MVKVEVTKIQSKGWDYDAKGTIEAQAGIGQSEEIPDYLINEKLIGVEKFPVGWRLNTKRAFQALHMGKYYLLTEEELESLSSK